MASVDSLPITAQIRPPSSSSLAFQAHHIFALLRQPERRQSQKHPESHETLRRSGPSRGDRGGFSCARIGRTRGAQTRISHPHGWSQGVQTQASIVRQAPDEWKWCYSRRQGQGLENRFEIPRKLLRSSIGIPLPLYLSCSDSSSNHAGFITLTLFPLGSGSGLGK